MATHQYSNSAFIKDGNASDSFDMFTDSEDSDNEWHRASVDVRTLPPDTTTTDSAKSNAAMRSQMMQQMQQQSMSMVKLPQSQNIFAPKAVQQMQQQSKSMMNVTQQMQQQSNVTQLNKKEKRERRKKKRKKSNKEANHDHRPHPKRAKAVMELISTEAAYVSHLKKLIKIYVNKLENSKKMIVATDYNVIFSTALITIATSHEQLLKDMQQRYTTYSDDHRWIISDILTAFCSYFKMYPVIIKNVHAQLHSIRKCLDNPKLYAFQQKHRKQFNGMTLSDLIILPIQRLIQYKALIQAITDQTNPTHPDAAGLHQIWQLISDIIIEHNEILYDLEARVKILNITNEIQNVPDLTSSARQFIFSEELYTIKMNGKPSKYTVYLFNDCLIYATESKHGKKCVFKMRLPIDSAFAVQAIDDLKKYKNIFAIYSSLESFIVTTKNNTELKTKWLQVLKKAIHDAQNRHYFHIDVDTARVGRGSVLISQAALQIPKHVQKQLNKKQASIPLRVPKSTASANASCDDEKHSSPNRVHRPVPSVRPPPPPQEPPANAAAPPTIFKANDMGAGRRRSSFGGCTTDKSVADYYKTPYHHVPQTLSKPKTTHVSSRSNPWIANSNTDLVAADTIDIDKGNAPQHVQSTQDMMKQLQQKSMSMRKIPSPQNEQQRTEIMRQMQQQSMSMQAITQSKSENLEKKAPERRVFRKSGKKPPSEKKKINEREVMREQLQQKSSSMRKIAPPRKEEQRTEILKQMQQQSMSERIVAQSKSEEKTLPQQKVFRRSGKKAPSEKKKKLPPPPPSKSLPKAIPKQSKSADIERKHRDKTSKPEQRNTKYNIKPKVNVKRGGIRNLVSRFNKEEDQIASSSSAKRNVDLSKMGMKSSRQNLLHNKSYDEYKTDADAKKIWNAYLNQQGEEASNEWALHGFIKAQPQLPSKTFRQARGIFRAFKGTGHVV